MKIPPNTTIHGEGHRVKAGIGNAANCRKAVSEAIAKRAYEIYQHQGCRPGQDLQIGALQKANSFSRFLVWS
jgi:hypothetical protein